LVQLYGVHPEVLSFHVRIFGYSLRDRKVWNTAGTSSNEFSVQELTKRPLHIF